MRAGAAIVGAYGVGGECGLGGKARGTDSGPGLTGMIAPYGVSFWGLSNGTNSIQVSLGGLPNGTNSIQV